MRPSLPDFESRVDRTLAAAERRQQQRDHKVTQRWNARAEGAFAAGASLAHRFSKPWALQEVIDSGSGLRGASQLADRKLEYWGEFWDRHGAQRGGQAPRR